MTDIDNIHTVTQLMEAAATALEERDGDALDRMQSKARDWLQDGAEYAAQASMLGSMAEAAYTLADHENN